MVKWFPIVVSVEDGKLRSKSSNCVKHYLTTFPSEKYVRGVVNDRGLFATMLKEHFKAHRFRKFWHTPLVFSAEYAYAEPHYGIWRIINEELGIQLKDVFFFYREEVVAGRVLGETETENRTCLLLDRDNFQIISYSDDEGYSRFSHDFGRTTVSCSWQSADVISSISLHKEVSEQVRFFIHQLVTKRLINNKIFLWRSGGKAYSWHDEVLSEIQVSFEEIAEETCIDAAFNDMVEFRKELQK